MAECVYCRSYTQMYISGSPVCIECAEDLRLGHKPGYRESTQDAESSETALRPATPNPPVVLRVGQPASPPSKAH